MTNSGVLPALGGVQPQSHARHARRHRCRTNLSGLKSSLFDRVEQGRIEEGNPENNLILSGNYRLGTPSASWLRTQRFGQVTSYGTTPTNAFGPLDQIFSAKWITDLSGVLRLRSVHA